jgi:HK97 family phage portal protein
MNILQKLFRLGGKKEKNLTMDSSSDSLLTAVFNKETITKDKALEIPVVNSAINYIANQIASIPIALYKIKDDNTIERVPETEDIRVKLLNGDTGDLLDCHQMIKAFVTDYLLCGNGYIYISQLRNKVVSYHYVDCEKIFRYAGSDPIFKDGYYLINGERYEEYQFIKILRSSRDGVRGYGILQENPQILSIAYNLMVFTGRMIKNGGNKKGFLKLDRNHADPEMKKIKEGWRNFYNAENGENMLILNAGMDFKESSNTAVELQLNENRQSINDDVLLLFGLSEGVINGTATDDIISGTFKTTIFPILHAIETALNKSNLLEKEKGTYYWAFDTTEILKDDIKTRFEAYKTAIEADFMQVDEVRRIENMSPLGLDFIKLGLNDVLYYPNTGEVYTPNTNQTTKPNQGGG